MNIVPVPAGPRPSHFTLLPPVTWETLLDGQARLLTSGVDFVGTPRALLAFASNHYPFPRPRAQFTGQPTGSLIFWAASPSRAVS